MKLPSPRTLDTRRHVPLKRRRSKPLITPVTRAAWRRINSVMALFSLVTAVLVDTPSVYRNERRHFCCCYPPAQNFPLSPHGRRLLAEPISVKVDRPEGGGPM